MLKAPPSIINNELELKKIGMVLTKPALAIRVPFPPDPTILPSPLTSIPPPGPDDDVWLVYGKDVFLLVSRYILYGARPVHSPIGCN